MQLLKQKANMQNQKFDFKKSGGEGGSHCNGM